MTRGRIDRIELHHVDVPLPTALFPVWIPGYPQHRLHYTLLTVRTREGLIGFATAPAFGREREGLGAFIGQFLVGLDAYDLEAVRNRLSEASCLGWRNGWMELAFWDLAAKSRGLPLHELILEAVGLPPRRPAPEAVPTYASFRELRPPRVRAESFERIQRLGFKAANISVHAMEEKDDFEQLAAARRAAGLGFDLSVHARQAFSISLVEDVPKWSFERALRFAEYAQALDYKWLKEPLIDQSWDELAMLRSRVSIPIAGGDLIPSFRLLKVITQLGCYSHITPDVVFAGMSAVVGIMRLCLDRGLDFSPASNSDGLGLAANGHVLAAWSRLVPEGRAGPGLEYPWEPPALLPEHRDTLLTRPLAIRPDGDLDVPSGPGLGVELDERALQRYAQPFYSTTPLRFASSVRRSGLTAGIMRPRRDRHRAPSRS